MTLDDFDLENHFVASCSLGRLFALLQGQLTVAPAINCLPSVWGSSGHRVSLGIAIGYSRIQQAVLMRSCACADSGHSCHFRPSSRQPPDFELKPPHCLKKNGTRLLLHWSRMPRTQSGVIGLRRGPLSPPTITQCMPSSGSCGMAASRGSRDRNLMRAGTCLRCAIRQRYSGLSTDTPCQMFGLQMTSPASLARCSGRLVNI